MKLVTELLQYPKHIENKQVYMFTGNRVINGNQLVMGKGNALACKKAYPSVPKKLASKINNTFNARRMHNIFVDVKDGLVGCMFTKNHYKDPSNLEDVIAAIADLDKTARKHENFTFHLPMPGVGLGGLSREDVDLHVNRLPDNVIVYVGD